MPNAQPCKSYAREPAPWGSPEAGRAGGRPAYPRVMGCSPAQPERPPSHSQKLVYTHYLPISGSKQEEGRKASGCWCAAVLHRCHQPFLHAAPGLAHLQQEATQCSQDGEMQTGTGQQTLRSPAGAACPTDAQWEPSVCGRGSLIPREACSSRGVAKARAPSQAFRSLQGPLRLSTKRNAAIFPKPP